MHPFRRFSDWGLQSEWLSGQSYVFHGHGGGFRCVSETHLSQVGRRSFVKMMQRHATQYTSFQFGHDVLPRSEVSDFGRWTGVGVLSRWPTRRLDHDWSPLLHATGRICVNTSFIHGHWISGCVVYAPPTGQTHGNAKHTADAILRVGLARLLQLAGPRYFGGDWNHDHHKLETVGILRQLGWVDIQDLNLTCWGIAPQATCRGKTRRDFLFLSPELACMFRSCSLYTWSWTDHCALVGTFACNPLDLERFPWPRPDAIDWSRFQNRPESPTFSFLEADDVSQCYAAFWKSTEEAVRLEAVRCGKPLPDRCFGRGQRTRPSATTFQVTPLRVGRAGDVRPSFLGFSHVHRLWFRQLRRLESFCRLVRHGVHCWNALEHRAFLWTSILNANGFRDGFSDWWVAQGHAIAFGLFIPEFPPPYVLAQKVFAAFQTVVADFESHLKQQQRYKAKLTKTKSIGALHKEVRRDPPEPVSVLGSFHYG